jgi:TonB-linked SusC/RagA family outer membrane protein
MRFIRAMLVLGTTALLSLATALPAQAQTGVIRGRVTDQSTGAPIQAAVLSLVGTNRTARSDVEGYYQFDNVPVGTTQVRVTAVGYSMQVAQTNLAAGEPTDLNFELRTVVINLDAVVVTATGEQRVRELANAVTTVNAAEAAEEKLPPTVASLIQGRSPGVQIINTSGTTGSSTKIRIRGSSSISLSNEPLVVVDGVRVDSRQADLAVGVGGQEISRLNDFNPDDIESIDVVKGPSAAALYGTEAANGVIVIKTKRGRVGPPRWNAYAEYGLINDVTTYPNNYRGVASDDSSCRLSQVSAGDCTQVGLETANPLASATTAPFKTGNRSQFGVNVAGGSEQVNYYLSGEFEQEDGIWGLPTHTRDSILEVVDQIPDYMDNPNSLQRVSLRANLSAALGNSATVNLSTGYVTSDIWLPQNDNNVLGMLPSGLLGGTDSTVVGGWGFYTPEEIFAIEVTQGIERFTQSAAFSWQPLEWLEARAVGGLDFASKSDIRFQGTGTGPAFTNYREGYRQSDKANTWAYTLDLGLTATYDLSDAFSTRTTVGFQYFRNFRQQTATTGQVLPPGAGSNKSAADQYIDEDYIETKTIGTFIEEVIGYNNRVFLNLALRGDDNSAFGSEFTFTTYPKVGISWLLLEGGIGVLDNFRLRSAWGASGQAPGTNDATLYYQGISVIDAGSETSGVTIQNPGNPDLKPEYSEEIEAGFESGFFDGHLGIDFTFYSRTTKDALVQRRLAPSLGLTTSRWENIGQTLNYGFELGINGTPIQSPAFTWSFNLSGSTNTNKVVELGEGVEPIVFGEQKHAEGYPLGAWFQESYTYEDANGDGIITTDEITFSDTTEFQGYPRPRYEVAFSNSIDISNRFRLSALFDYRGGHLMENFTEAFRCRFNICQGLNDPDVPLDEQARAQTQRSSVQTVTGFLEPGWFIKLRELSFTFFAPTSWARAIRASRLNFTVTGRNLFTITDYTGVDPEVQGQGGSNFGSREFLTQAQVRSWSARLQLTF